MEEEILGSLAPKLGLKGERVKKKAAEYMRLADIRGMNSSMSSLNLSGSCKAVMCLELAALSLGDQVDKMTAMRVSGMRNKKMYNCALRAMECILELQSKITVTDLVIQFGCPEAKKLTLQLLKRHEEEQNKQENVELSQILFNAAALYVVCRHLKNRIDKRKLIELTGVTRIMFDRVTANMEKCLSAILKGQKNIEPKANKRCPSFIEQLEKTADDDDLVCKKSKSSQSEVEEEPYEVWRDRILDTAYKALGKTYHAGS